MRKLTGTVLSKNLKSYTSQAKPHKPYWVTRQMFSVSRMVVVGGGVQLYFAEDRSDLSKAVLAVKTIRNNLFHGRKDNAAGWDEPKRVRFLLRRRLQIIDSFARLAGLKADYERRY